MRTWKRVKEQEGGNVYRWFESSEGHTASVVEGAPIPPGEMEVRITDDDFNRLPSVVGHASIMKKRSDRELMASIERSVSRWKVWSKR